jgi:hypothetical protein
VSEDVDETGTERIQMDPFEAHIAAFSKAGYDVGLRFKGGVLASVKGCYGFLPCPGSVRGVNPFLLKEWVPSLSLRETLAFLGKAALVVASVAPRESVVDCAGSCVGVRTQGGSFVRCLPEPLPTANLLRKTTEHELSFPKTGFLYGTYRDLVRVHGVEKDAAEFSVEVERTDDFPQWRSGKLLLTAADKERFAAQLKNDMAKFHRVRCYILRQCVEVKGETIDQMPDEHVMVL